MTKKGRDILKQKGDAESRIKRGLSSVVDGFKRIRIAASGTAPRDFEGDDDYEGIDVNGSKIYVSTEIEETYSCNPKYEPFIPSATKSEKLFKMNGDSYTPDPVHGEPYNPDVGGSIAEKVEVGTLNPVIGLGKSEAVKLDGFDTVHSKPNEDGIAVEEEVDVSDLFKGTFVFGEAPPTAKKAKKNNVETKKEVLEETKPAEGPVAKTEIEVEPKLPEKIEVPVEKDTPAEVPEIQPPEKIETEAEPADGMQGEKVESVVDAQSMPVEEHIRERPVTEAVVEAPMIETPIVEAPVEAPVVEEPVEVPAVEEPVAEIPVVEAPVEVPAVEEPVAEIPVVEEPINQADIDYNDEVIIFGDNGTKLDTKGSVPVVEYIDSEIGVTKEDLDNQNKALFKAFEEIVASGDDSDDVKIVAQDSVTASIDEMVEHKIEDKVVIESSTKEIILEKPKSDVVSDLVSPAVAVADVIENKEPVTPVVKAFEGVVDDLPSKTETEDVPVMVKSTKKVKTGGCLSKKKVLMNDRYSKLSEPSVHRPLRYTGGNLVSAAVPVVPKKSEATKKRATTTELTLTKEVEEKKEERQTLNSIMAKSVEESKVVVPMARRLVLEPIKIDDEVEDVMRLTVPNLDAEEFGEEDFADFPEDGIEEIVCSRNDKDECQVVFSFGGDGYGDEGVTFYFGL